MQKSWHLCFLVRTVTHFYLMTALSSQSKKKHSIPNSFQHKIKCDWKKNMSIKKAEYEVRPYFREEKKSRSVKLQSSLFPYKASRTGPEIPVCFLKQRIVTPNIDRFIYSSLVIIISFAHVETAFLCMCLSFLPSSVREVREASSRLHGGVSYTSD